MGIRNSLTAKRLRQLLDYDPAIGQFTWLVNTKPQSGGRGSKGNRAGTRTNKRPMICIDGRQYRASRLAFLWMTGRWPQAHIDHINLDSADNRWINLREATHSQNGANCKPRGELGFKGVQFDQRGRRKYIAKITVNSRTIRLGCFDSPEEAHAAYCAAAEKYFGEFARPS
jgi:hypothetical protein